MFRGLLSGLFWGAVVSILGLATVSLVMEPPVPTGGAPESVDVAVPAGSEFNRNRPEAPPVIPGSEETAAGDDAPLVTEADVEQAPLADTASAAVPESTSEAPVVAGAPETNTSELNFSAGDEEANSASDAPVIAAPDQTEETVPEAPELPLQLTETEQDSIAVEPEQPEATETAATSPTIQLPENEESSDSEEPTLVLADESAATESESGEVLELAVEENVASQDAQDGGALVLQLPEPNDGASDATENTTLAQTDTSEGSDAITLDLSDGSNSNGEEVELALAAPSDEDGTTLSIKLPTIGSEGDTEVEAPTTGRSIKLPTIGQQDDENQDVAVKLPTIGEPQDEESEATQQNTGRLVVSVPQSQRTATEEAEDTSTPETTPIEMSALSRNAQPFTRPDDKPLMSIVLIDVGNEGLGRDGLQTFSFPITIAVNPALGDAISAGAAYKSAGLEVIVQAPPLPETTTPEQVGDYVAGLVNFVPQAVGLVDASQGGFQSNRMMVDSAVEALAEGGHALLTYDRGLNTAQQMAEAEGLTAGTIFRVLDAEREDASTIKRYLDRAAIRADQEGHVIMIGHSYPETVTAIFTWMMEGRGSRVTLAPLSAVLRDY